ncbi:MAG UNVERIFIED_CONTAM: hypothetical protein LVR18_05715 [Planctomycetaceae bacterium]
MGLAASLAGQGRAAEREAIQKKSQVLARIRVQLSEVRPNDPAAARRLADEARSIGLIEAANAFSRLADTMPPWSPVHDCLQCLGCSPVSPNTSTAVRGSR